jgi:hypothetical protein
MAAFAVFLHGGAALFRTLETRKIQPLNYPATRAYIQAFPAILKKLRRVGPRSLGPNWVEDESQSQR